MRSKDVIHDFYVAQFRVKEDVVPGITTKVIVNPNKVGTYQVICAELCGAGHGVMRARVIVMRPSAYDAWYAQAQRDVAAQSGRRRRTPAVHGPRPGRPRRPPRATATP